MIKVVERDLPIALERISLQCCNTARKENSEGGHDVSGTG